MRSLRLRVILPTWFKHIIDKAVDAADGTGTLDRVVEAEPAVFGQL